MKKVLFQIGSRRPTMIPERVAQFLSAKNRGVYCTTAIPESEVFTTAMQASESAILPENDRPSVIAESNSTIQIAESQVEESPAPRRRGRRRASEQKAD